MTDLERVKLYRTRVKNRISIWKIKARKSGVDLKHRHLNKLKSIITSDVLGDDSLGVNFLFKFTYLPESLEMFKTPNPLLLRIKKRCDFIGKNRFIAAPINFVDK